MEGCFLRGGQQGNTYALRNAELYLPPYLFDKFGSGELADRPAIVSAPSRVAYGELLELKVQSDLPIEKLTFIRPGSGTHSTNMEQRAVAAPHVDLGDGRVQWTAPANGRLAPPGYYMLFAVDTAGVPSVARMVQLGRAGTVFDDLEFASPGFQITSDQQDVALQVIAHSSSDLSLEYSANGLPSGLAIDSSSGLISGVPYLSGEYSTTINSTDGASRYGSVTFQWEVVAEPPTGQPLAEGLSGFWPIYDSSAVESDAHDAVDLIGSADGIPVGNAEYVDDSARGRVLKLDGIEDHMRLPIDVSETAASYSLWFKTEASNVPLFSSSTDTGGSNTDRNLFLHGDGLSVSLGPQEISGGRSYADNTWHQVVYTHGSAGQMLYVDGELIAEGSRQRSTQTGQAVLLVGSDPARSAAQFDGLIDNIRYYDSQLDGAAVFLLHTKKSNTAPTLEPVPNRQSEVGDAALLQLQASDSEGQRLSYFAQSLPIGLQLNSDTGRISGTFSTIGNYAVEFAVRDSVGASSIREMTWAVSARSEVNQRPQMDALSSVTHTVGQTVRVIFVARDPDGDVLRYGASGLPTGLTLNALSGVVGGTANQSGDFSVSISATDPAGLGVSKSFSWTIEADTSVLSQLRMTSENPPAAIQGGVQTHYAVLASSTTAVQYSWSFGDGSADLDWSANSNVSHVFERPGRYGVTVFARSEAGAQSRLHFEQRVHAELTEAKPLSSSGLLLDERRGRVWVANPDNNTVTLLDAAAQRVLKEIPVGEQPVSLALAGDGSVWVTNKSSATISVIANDSLSLLRSYDLPGGSQPHGLLLSADTAYVALEASGQVLALSVSDGRVLRSVSVAPKVRGLALSADRRELLVSRFVSPVADGESSFDVNLRGGGGELHLLAAETFAHQSVVQLPGSFIGDSDVSGNGLPNYLAAPVISPDGLFAWVPSKQDNIGRGQARNGMALNHQNTVRAVASKIRISDWSHSWHNRVDFDNSSVASAAAFEAKGNYLLVTLESSAELAVIDAHDSGMLGRVAVGRAPSAVAVSVDGSKAWVHNFVDRSLSVIDTSDFFAGVSEQLPVVKTIDLVAKEKLSAQVLLGKQLFHDASDERLALENYMSCASCHNDGDSDGRVWDFSQFGEGLRNTTSLRGKGAAAHGVSHWSGNFDEIQDFEGQIRGFALGRGLMSQSDFEQHRDPMGSPKAGLSEDLDALAAYLGSLDTMPENPYSVNGFSAAALRGEQVFAIEQCDSCHSGSAMTDSATTRRHDIGSLKASSGQRLGGVLDGLDTPTLLNLHETAPYLHDGSAALVREAVSAHTVANDLSGAELDDLQAYLLELPAPVVAAVASAARQVNTGGGAGGFGLIFLLIFVRLARRVH